MLAGMHCATDGHDGDGDEVATGAWKASLRGLLHEVVDALLDNTTYADDYAVAVYKEMSGYFVGSGKRRR